MDIDPILNLAGWDKTSLDDVVAEYTADPHGTRMCYELPITDLAGAVVELATRLAAVKAIAESDIRHTGRLGVLAEEVMAAVMADPGVEACELVVAHLRTPVSGLGASLVYGEPHKRLVIQSTPIQSVPFYRFRRFEVDTRTRVIVETDTDGKPLKEDQ